MSAFGLRQVRFNLAINGGNVNSGKGFVGVCGFGLRFVLAPRGDFFLGGDFCFTKSDKKLFVDGGEGAVITKSP